MSKEINRREFLRTAGIASAGLVIGGMGLSSKSYARILGANERVNLCFMGLGSRGGRGAQQARTFVGAPNIHISYLADVDSENIAECMKRLSSMIPYKPIELVDFRKALDDKELDGVIISAPDHWHAPAAIMCAQAKKHVFLEKPVSHSPREGELLIEAAKKYNVLIETGTQRRSFPFLQRVMKMIHDGEIGKVFMGKAWYTNNRKETYLKPGTVPANLNYELWQGPAPRRPYMEGLIHYDWHWFWHWGTGEALNNGTHELDLLVWGAQAGFPTKVSSMGGRYVYNDHWETPDTQLITWETPNAVFSWEGRSRNNTNVEGEGRGVIFYGDKGSIETGNLFYKMYDLSGKLIREESVADPLEPGQKAPSPNARYDILHDTNFVEAIRGKEKLNCPVNIGHQTNIWVQLGNIAQRTGRMLQCNPANGHILNDPEAMRLWSREYEKGWEPKL